MSRNTSQASPSSPRFTPATRSAGSSEHAHSNRNVLSGNMPGAPPTCASSFSKICTWRASSQHWRAMFILNSHGASGKSQSERPAPSSACSSPTKMPCMRSWRRVFDAASFARSGSFSTVSPKPGPYASNSGSAAVPLTDASIAGVNCSKTRTTASTSSGICDSTVAWALSWRTKRLSRASSEWWMKRRIRHLLGGEGRVLQPPEGLLLCRDTVRAVSRGESMQGPKVLRWETLTKKQFDTIDRARAVVLVTGSPMEVHGPHLPLGADCLEGEGLAERMLRFLPERHLDRTFLKLPFVYAAADPVPQPGSLAFRPSTTIAFFEDLGHSLAAQGFRNVLVSNFHGSPRHFVAPEVACDRVARARGIQMLCV